MTGLRDDGTAGRGLTTAATARSRLPGELGRTALASSAYVAADGLARAVSLLLALVYTRYLTRADFGVFAIASTITLLLTPVLGLSISAGLSRLWFEAADEDERRRLYASVLAFLLVVPTGLVAALEVLGDVGLLDVFRYTPYDPYLRYAVLTAYCSVFVDLAVSIFIVRRRPGVVLALTCAQAALILVASLLLVVTMHEGLLGALRALLVATAVMALVSIALVARMARGVSGLSRGLVRLCLLFGVPLIPAALSQWLLQVSDRPILSHFVSAGTVGEYYVGYSIGAIAGLAVHGTSRALSPVVTRALKEDEHERVARIGTYSFALLVFVCAVVALFGRDVLTLVIGSGFGEAPAVVPVVAFAHVAFAAYVIVTQGIWFGMRTRLVPVLTFAAAVVNIGLNLVLIPRYGMLAAAWDTAAGFGALALFHGILAHRVYPISWEFGRWLKIGVAAAAAYAVASVAGTTPSFARLGAELAGLAIVFPGALVVLRFWVPSEVAVARHLIGGARRR